MTKINVMRKVFLNTNILVAFFLFASTRAMAYDFQMNGVYYNISDSTNLKAEVTAGITKYSGKVTIPSSVSYNEKSYNVTGIGEFAFKKCSDLTSVSLPMGINTIDNYAFYGCSGLLTLTLPGSTKTIGSSAFDGCSNLKTITLSDSLETIGSCAFWNCSNLSTLNIPKSVTSIGYLAFFSCTSISSFTVDNENTSFLSNEGSLYNSSMTVLIQARGSSLKTTATIPNQVTTIGNSAFFYYPYLTSVTLPKTVNKIEADAFYCPILAEIHCNASTPPVCESFVFANVDTTSCKLYVPTGSKSIYASATGWKSFTNIIEEDINSVHSTTQKDLTASLHNGLLSVYGLDANSVIKVYAMNGICIGEVTAEDGKAQLNTLRKAVIVKMDDKYLKVASE